MRKKLPTKKVVWVIRGENAEPVLGYDLPMTMADFKNVFWMHSFTKLLASKRIALITLDKGVRP